MTYRKGFTLIEMLVVIAIIGILATIVLVGLGPVQRQARDARRVADLKNIQNALELYNSKYAHYPVSTTFATMRTTLMAAGTGVVDQVPVDPVNVAPHIYQYESVAPGTTYVLGAILEDNTSADFKSSFSGTINGTACQTTIVFTTGLYCVST